LKILIVDDNAKIRELIKKALVQYNKNSVFVECGDGEDAIDLFVLEKPDLVLMDIMMKRMDGFTAMKKILAFSPEAKIIAVSQLPEQEYKTEAISCGAVDYLNKENLFQLRQIIEKHVKRNTTT
jgi:two-component system, chemotaxis family, chemotaxis protein CheY